MFNYRLFNGECIEVMKNEITYKNKLKNIF